MLLYLLIAGGMLLAHKMQSDKPKPTTLDANPADPSTYPTTVASPDKTNGAAVKDQFETKIPEHADNFGKMPRGDIAQFLNDQVFAKPGAVYDDVHNPTGKVGAGTNYSAGEATSGKPPPAPVWLGARQGVQLAGPAATAKSGPQTVTPKQIQTKTPY